ncbi:MAG: hypothetical protein E4H27_09710 [Anaerolineales bacterium]|nr:MAG: hypothetical protein E4H27_09710 [Anaerolineales bacterium]
MMTLLVLSCGFGGAIADPETSPVTNTVPAPTSTLLPATAGPIANLPPWTLATETRVLWRVGGDGIFASLGGMDTDGENVYIAEAYQGILVFDLKGNSQGVISPGEIGYVVDVKVGPQGNLYMVDRAFHQVSMFNHDGDPLGAFGGIGTGNGAFGSDSPRSLAVGPEGEVFVLDHNQDAQGQALSRIQVFSVEGDFLRSFTLDPENDGQAIAVSPDNTLLLSSQKGYIAEFAPDSGQLIQKLGLESLRDIYPQAIAVDDAGTMYVTAQIPAAVAVLDPLGKLVAWIGEETVRTDEGWPAGEFVFPFGIAVSPDGRTLFAGDTFETFSYVTAFERQ